MLLSLVSKHDACTQTLTLWSTVALGIVCCVEQPPYYNKSLFSSVCCAGTDEGPHVRQLFSPTSTFFTIHACCLQNTQMERHRDYWSMIRTRWLNKPDFKSSSWLTVLYVSWVKFKLRALSLVKRSACLRWRVSRRHGLKFIIISKVITSFLFVWQPSDAVQNSYKLLLMMWSDGMSYARLCLVDTLVFVALYS